MGSHASKGSAVDKVPSSYPDRGLKPIGDNFTFIPFGYFLFKSRGL